MTIFFHESKKQEGRCWALLYKAGQILLNHSLYYLESTVQQKYLKIIMDFPELLLRMVFHLFAVVEFGSGTEMHKGVGFLFIYYIYFLTYLYLLTRHVFPQALTSFIYY